MKSTLENVVKHETKLRNIVELNKIGSTIYTDSASEVLNAGCSKSEFIAALKKDIDKTSSDLIESYGILSTIKNGIVNEIKVPETVENFFGTCYSQSENAVKLSGVKFNLNSNNPFPEKRILSESIYQNILDISKKELSQLSKAISLYEETNDEMKKAILYPSLNKADELIEKIGMINQKFNNFVKKMDYKQKNLFNTTFKRSGVTEVIQNSSYIDKDGIQQSIHNDKSSLRRIASMLMNQSLKYIEAVEIDNDGDPSKVLTMIKQIERLKINSEYKFTLKIRKLGNLNARGVFFQSGLVVAEDYRDTSALLHEIAHLIHITNPAIYNNKFVNHMIKKLGDRYTTANLPELIKPHFDKKYAYYTDPKEIIARGLEIASLLAFEEGRFIQGDNEFHLIKSRAYYSEFEGIYFDFLSFDEEMKKEMLELYKMFYETSFGETFNSNIDNFIKIDTRYDRTYREKTFSDIMRENRQLEEKERKTLYTLVNLETLPVIIKNKGSLQLKDIATKILLNISYCGGHNKSMTVKDWAKISIEKSKIVLSLLQSVKDDIGLAQYIVYLYELKNNKVIDSIANHVLLQGFSMKSRLAIKKEMKELEDFSVFTELLNLRSLILKTPLLLADTELLSRKAFIYSLIDSNPSIIMFLHECEFIEADYTKCLLYFLEEHPDKISYVPSKIIISNIQVFRKILELTENYIDLRLITTAYQLKILVEMLCDKFPDSLIPIFQRVGLNLRNDFEFMSKYILINEELEEFIGPEIKDLFLKPTETITIEVVENAPNASDSSIESQPKEVIKNKKIVSKKEDVESNYDLYTDYISKSKIEDFVHTKTGEILKVMRIEEKIEDFKSFNSYLIKNKIAKYNFFAKAFFINNLEKVTSIINSNAKLYEDEQIQIFSNGRLF